MNHSKYTKEECYEIAKTCKTRVEFQTKNQSAYKAASRNKWLDEWIKPTKYGKGKTKYPYEVCKELASKFSCRNHFFKNYRQAYKKSLENGWLDEWFGADTKYHGKRVESSFNYEKCKELAKGCKNRKEFWKGYCTAYKKSLENGWLDEFFGEAKQVSKYTYEVCKEIAQTCCNRKEFQMKNNCAYQEALKNGWNEEWFDDRPRFVMEAEISGVCMDLGLEFIHDKMTEWSEDVRPDFYVPSKNIVIECQGIQHFESVKYWGGEEGLKKRQRKDKKKRELCKKNNIKLVYYANYKYDFPYEVITNLEEIKKILL